MPIRKEQYTFNGSEAFALDVFKQEMQVDLSRHVERAVKLGNFLCHYAYVTCMSPDDAHVVTTSDSGYAVAPIFEGLLSDNLQTEDPFSAHSVLVEISSPTMSRVRKLSYDHELKSKNIINTGLFVLSEAMLSNERGDDIFLHDVPTDALSLLPERYYKG